jgi:hypothetical protein
MAESRAMRMAEGKLTSDEKRAIAEGKAVHRVVRSKESQGFEPRSLRMAEGKLSANEQRAIADGDAVKSLQAAIDVQSSEALRLAEGKLSRAEQRAIANGDVPVKANKVHESRALRLAEGKLNRDQKRAIADGEVHMHEDEHASKALLLAEGKIALDASGGETSGAVMASSAHRRDDGEALRLAEGAISHAQKRRIADGMTTGEVRSAAAKQSHGRSLEDLTPAERTMHIQHLLEVAKQIGARKYRARAQQLAEEDSSMSGSAP